MTLGAVPEDATVMVRVGGLGSLIPAVSVTVRMAVKVPELGKVTAPGFCRALIGGVPPRMDQEYPAIAPLGAEPLPANVSDCPGAMETSEAGLVIVPVGGRSVGAVDTRTNFATEGTPALLIKKSM